MLPRSRISFSAFEAGAIREHEIEHGGIVVGRSPNPQSLGRRGGCIDRESLRTQVLRNGLTETLVIFDDEQSQWAISLMG
jgi:hypothetical protein